MNIFKVGIVNCWGSVPPFITYFWRDLPTNEKLYKLDTNSHKQRIIRGIIGDIEILRNKKSNIFFKLFDQRRKIDFFIVIGIYGGNIFSSQNRIRKEVNSMNLSPSEISAKQLRFENYCKKVLRNAVIDYERVAGKKSKREIVFSEFSEHFFDALYTTDEYSITDHLFNVLGEDIFVKDDRLAEALRTLTQERLDIILLRYFFEMTDTAIGEEMNIQRSNIQKRRKSTLEELKTKMEKNENE